MSVSLIDEHLKSYFSIILYTAYNKNVFCLSLSNRKSVRFRVNIREVTSKSHCHFFNKAVPNKHK